MSENREESIDLLLRAARNWSEYHSGSRASPPDETPQKMAEFAGEYILGYAKANGLTGVISKDLIGRPKSLKIGDMGFELKRGKDFGRMCADALALIDQRPMLHTAMAIFGWELSGAQDGVE